MTTNLNSPFKIESIDLATGQCLVRFINKYGVIYTGEKTLDNFKTYIDIPSGSFELDGTPIMKQVESVITDNPNEDYVWNIDIPLDENGNFISTDDLIAHIAKHYPHDIFEKNRKVKEASSNDSLLNLVGNNFEVTLTVPDLQTIQEDPMISIRNHRNMLLIESDWTQLIDSNPPNGKEVWAEYRQKLRDLPNTINNINEVIWPVSPT